MSSLNIIELLRVITNKYQFYSSVVILFIGLIGNILIILMFNILRIFRGNQCAYYLKIESMANIGVLLAMLPSNIASYIIGRNPVHISVAWCKIQSMSSYSFGLYSLCTICFLAFDQYLSTNHRQHWRYISTLKLAYRLSFFNITIVLLHGILFLIFTQTGPLGCTVYHPTVNAYFTFFYYPILSCVLPITISGLFSLLAYQNVRRIIRRQIPLMRRRLDRQMTAIALTRVMCIVSLGIPFIIWSLFRLNITYHADDHVEEAILNLSSVVIYSILYTNYAINFYLFLMISPRYRHQVKYFFIKKLRRSLTILSNPRLIISKNNQVAPEPTQASAFVLECV
ncbi:unnamed protein product [Rotaria sordida]|uniref:G-protein coupled receptors family 1 profile domain-containing protein n=1 Tax=Rotaria sordida TaxID=392033 RepID=A0A814M3U0_9BILA|nr:unnamed protein product [Rotaria sordida]